jgi:hypothetical protein
MIDCWDCLAGYQWHASEESEGGGEQYQQSSVLLANAAPGGSYALERAWGVGRPLCHLLRPGMMQQCHSYHSMLITYATSMMQANFTITHHSSLITLTHHCRNIKSLHDAG